MNFKISLDACTYALRCIGEILMTWHEKLYFCDAHRTTLIVSTLVAHGSNEIHPWRQQRKNSPRSISSSIQWNPSDAGFDHVKDLIFFRIDILPTDAVNIEWCAFLPSRPFFLNPNSLSSRFMGDKFFKFFLICCWELNPWLCRKYFAVPFHHNQKSRKCDSLKNT